VEAGLAFGGNLGDTRALFARARKMIGQREIGRFVATSSLWATPPWGLVDQPAFLNACAIIETQLAPHALLDAVKQIERDLGRAPAVRWGPRALDIDILFYGDLTIRDARLEVPHPRMLERAFVLAPLAEIAPDRVIAGHAVRDALSNVDRTGIERLETSSLQTGEPCHG
jgi:2-amino-4-hydroxy-6-hydroxymethyldihydropteridine diphosphokinase